MCNNKIEVLNKKIYLNCSSIKSILFKLNPLQTAPAPALYKTIKQLQEATIKFNKKEEDFKNHVKLQSGILYDKDKQLICSSHFTYHEEGNTIHQTSKAPNILLPNQSRGPSLKTLENFDAKDPATIITTGVCHIKELKKHVFVKKSDLDAIKFQFRDKFHLDSDTAAYQYEKTCTYTEIIHNNLGQKHGFDHTLIKELCANHFTNTLLTETNDSIKAAIEEDLTKE